MVRVHVETTGLFQSIRVVDTISKDIGYEHEVKKDLRHRYVIWNSI